jgi:hypothetical protein
MNLSSKDRDSREQRNYYVCLEIAEEKEEELCLKSV